MSAEQEMILRTVVAPLAVGGVAGVLCWLPRLPNFLRQLLSAVAACGAVLLVYWLERGWPEFPPERALHWLFPVGVASVVAVVLGLIFPKARWWAVTALILFVVWTHATRGGKWHGDALLWVVIFCAAAGWVASLWAVDRALPGRMGQLALSGIFGALAVTLMLTKSVLLAQLSGGMACALLGLAVCGRTLSGALLAPMAAVALFLSLHGHIFSKMQVVEMLLLAFGGLLVLAAALVQRFFPAMLRPAVVAALAVAVPALTALWVLMRVRPWDDPYF